MQVTFQVRLLLPRMLDLLSYLVLNETSTAMVFIMGHGLHYSSCYIIIYIW
jgi:hypothetical protein